MTTRMIIDSIDVSTRKKRKKALMILMEAIQKLCDAEEEYLWRMPANLKNGEMYAITDRIIYDLYHVIITLASVYDH